eukprot:TRINITY_DN2282_c0_g1_i1.p1 TRINITY_DN2282_c0_g1~~TRINITY_DN2282_c0_g1_i1.p1  ORF type:complete len:137 (+),score=24.27 TRINITY_DN2282_c0_g1_i1:64-474(+)
MCIRDRVSTQSTWGVNMVWSALYRVWFEHQQRLLHGGQLTQGGNAGAGTGNNASGGDSRMEIERNEQREHELMELIDRTAERDREAIQSMSSRNYNFSDSYKSGEINPQRRNQPHSAYPACTAKQSCIVSCMEDNI